MVSAVALPPVSRKLAEEVWGKRREWRTSFVFIARPAPLTRVPIRRVEGGREGCKGMKTMEEEEACLSDGVRDEVSRRAWRVGWRFEDVKAASSKKR